MAASIPCHCPLFLSAKPKPLNHRFRIAPISRPSQAAIRALRRNDFEGFARRLVSGEALRDVWLSANEGIERLAFEARRAAERIDRRYAVSGRIGSAARAASMRAHEIDLEIGISRWWRSLSMDFYRSLPRYRRELNGFLQTPIGRGLMMAFFFWFALSGWLFKFFIIATWVLPFAGPLLFGTFVNNFVIQGACPACKRQFIGNRSQVIRCAGCRNIVWQPDGVNFSSNRWRQYPSSEPSEADIIDIEIEEK